MGPAPQAGSTRSPSTALSWGDDLLVALALVLVAVVLSLGGWTWRADRVVYDASMSLWRRPPPADVVVVAIDDASIQAIGRWPWSRTVHATLLERLAAAQPRAVLLDLVLSEPDADPRQDELLAAALRRSGPVVLPMPWTVLPDGRPGLLEPVPALAAEARLGVSEAAVDADGVLRNGFLEAGPDAAIRPNVAWALLRAGGESVHPSLAVEEGGEFAPGVGWQRRGRFLLRFDGPPGHFRQISYVDLLQGAVTAESLRDHYVLVGMTAQGLGDTLATPVNAERKAMPGVEVLAHTLQTLRTGRAPQAWSALAVATGSALALVLLVLGFRAGGTRAALAVALLVQPLALAASVGALGLGHWFSPVPFMLAAALGYPLWSWRRLERGVDLLDREIARLSAEPGVVASPGRSDPVPRRDRLGTRLAALTQAAETVRSAQRFLADALAGLPTAMLVDDGGGRVLLGNPAAAALFEVESADELRGLDLARLLAEFQAVEPVDWLASLQALRRNAVDLAVRVQRPGLGDHLVQGHVAAMAGGMRVLVAITDISAIARAERAREELLAFVSHDLRSPATSIDLLAGLQLAGRGVLAGDELLREIQRLARRTLALADDFVRVAQAAQRPLSVRPTALAALLDEVRSDFLPQAVAAGVTLHVLPPQGAAEWPMDRALVLRALGNLVSNAIRHGAEGSGVTLRAEAPAGGHLALVVDDQGPGLDEASLRRLNDGDSGLVPTQARGVGFGLVFVQQVARRHQGRLQVTALQPRGSSFRLELGALPPG